MASRDDLLASEGPLGARNFPLLGCWVGVRWWIGGVVDRRDSLTLFLRPRVIVADVGRPCVSFREGFDVHALALGSPPSRVLRSASRFPKARRVLKAIGDEG